MSPPRRQEIRPWPKPVRYLIGISAVIFVVAVFLLYDVGVLTLVGPFVVAIVAVPVVVGVGWLFTLSSTRQLAKLRVALNGWQSVLEQERTLPRTERKTAASDDSLDAAIGIVQRGRAAFERNLTASAAETAATLSEHIGDWNPRARLTRALQQAARIGRRQARMLNKLERRG